MQQAPHGQLDRQTTWSSKNRASRQEDQLRSSLSALDFQNRQHQGRAIVQGHRYNDHPILLRSSTRLRSPHQVRLARLTHRCGERDKPRQFRHQPVRSLDATPRSSPWLGHTELSLHRAAVAPTEHPTKLIYRLRSGQELRRAFQEQPSDQPCAKCRVDHTKMTHHEPEAKHSHGSG